MAEHEIFRIMQDPMHPFGTLGHQLFDPKSSGPWVFQCDLVARHPVHQLSCLNRFSGIRGWAKQSMECVFVPKKTNGVFHSESNQPTSRSHILKGGFHSKSKQNSGSVQNQQGEINHILKQIDVEKWRVPYKKTLNHPHVRLDYTQAQDVI